MDESERVNTEAMYAIYETEGSQLLFFGEGEEDIVDLNEAEEFLRNLAKSILMVWLPSISRAKYFGRLVKLPEIPGCIVKTLGTDDLRLKMSLPVYFVTVTIGGR